LATLRRCDSDIPSAEVSLDGRAETWIGRSPENEIVLPDSEVSRRHAKVVRDSDGWSIVDNGSQNGVVIAGRRVSSHRLRDGDIIRIGTYDLQFAAHSPGMAACVRCGVEIEQGSRFCRKCGAPQDFVQPVAPAPPPPPPPQQQQQQQPQQPQPAVAPPPGGRQPAAASRKPISGFAVGCLVASIVLLLATAGVSLYVLYVNGYLPLR